MASRELDRVIALVGRVGLSSQDVVVVLADSYNDANRASFDPAHLSDAEADELRRWAMSAGWYELGLDVALPLHIAMSSKVSRIHQAACSTCTPGNAFTPTTFPVGLPPWSHQSTPEIGKAFRAAVMASDLYRERYSVPVAGDSPVCLRLVFVLEVGASMKDCDNMAKGLVDAFQGLLFDNDRQVEHLDLIKVHHAAGSEGYVLVRLWPTTINDHSDVLTPQHAQILWMDRGSLDLEPFLPHP